MKFMTISVENAAGVVKDNILQAHIQSLLSATNGSVDTHSILLLVAVIRLIIGSNGTINIFQQCSLTSFLSLAFQKLNANDDIIEVLDLIVDLLVSKDNRSYFAQDMNLLKCLVQLLTIGALVPKVLTIFHTLAQTEEDEINENLVKRELGLISKLREFAEGTDECSSAIAVLRYICTADKAKDIVLEDGILPLLMRIAREGRSDADRVHALTALYGMAYVDHIAKAFVRGPISVLQLMLDIARDRDASASVRECAYVGLWNFARVPDLRVDLALSEENIMKLLVDAVKTRKLTEGQKDAVLGTLWQTAGSRDARVAEVLLREEAHVVCTEEVKSNIDENSSFYALGCLLNLSRNDIACQPLKECGVVELASKETDNSAESTAVMCLILLSLLVGKDEAGGGKASHITAARISRLISVLNSTLNGEGGEDYEHGVFSLAVLTHGCLLISQSDSNKTILADSIFVQLACRILTSFQLDGSDLGNFVGGGGDDVESASYTLEALAQLSFHFKLDCDLQALLKKHTPGASFADILLRMQDNAKLDKELLGLAKNLHLRLTSSGVDNAVLAALEAKAKEQQGQASAAGGSGVRPKHIMLSYCWNKTANPHIVKELGSCLKAMGYDVWRDEEGSQILGPMGGSINEMMAKAVELSDTVVICVSEAYKNSVNCHLEADYAKILSNRSQVKIVYAMMDAGYTTVSSPKFCDGWLGLMIGSVMWYGLWDTAMVAKSAAEMVSVFHPSTKLDPSIARSRGGDAAPIDAAVGGTETAATSASDNIGALRMVGESVSQAVIDKLSRRVYYLVDLVEKLTPSPAAAADAVSAKLAARLQQPQQ